MRRIIVILVIVFTANLTGFSQTSIAKQCLDSIITTYGYSNRIDKHFFSYDNRGNTIFYFSRQEGDDCIDEYKEEYAYDNNNNRTMYIINIRSLYSHDNNWRQRYNDKFEYMYDSKGNKTMEIYYGWDNGWVAGGKTEYTYDNRGNLIVCIQYYWNNDINMLITLSKDEYIYDSKGNKTVHFRYNWNNVINDWSGADKMAEWSYDDKGNLTMYVNGDSKVEYEYDNNGNRTKVVRYNWNSYTWVVESNDEYEYNNNGKIKKHIFSGSPHDDYEAEYEYDNNVNLIAITYIYQDIHHGDSKFEWIHDLSYSKKDLIVPINIYYYNGLSLNFSSDNSNMLKKEIFYKRYWQPGTDWIEENSTIYYWSAKNIEVKTGVLDIAKDNSGIRIYPNPTNGQLIIECNDGACPVTTGEYYIYNVIGQVVMCGKLQCKDAACHVSTTINVESLAKGMYYLKIDGKTIKIIKN